MIFQQDAPRPNPPQKGATCGADPENPSHDSEACTVSEGLGKMVQLLPRIMRGMRRRPEEPMVLDGETLGQRHGSALSILREHETTVGALAAELDLNLATVSGLVADLERVGFAERSADPADRRRTIVKITPCSEALVDAWLEGATAPIVRALQRLNPEERTIFIRAMGYLEEELNAARNAEPGTRAGD